MPAGTLRRYEVTSFLGPPGALETGPPPWGATLKEVAGKASAGTVRPLGPFPRGLSLSTSRKESPIARRSFSTFSKRQRELSRLDKQQEKAERREQRKLEKQQNPQAGGPEIDFDAATTPLGPIRQ